MSKGYGEILILICASILSAMLFGCCERIQQNNSEFRQIFVQNGNNFENKEDHSVNSLKQTEWWTTIQKDLQAQEYHFSYQKKSSHPDLEAAYSAPNRAQNLRTFFSKKGIKITRRTEKNPAWDVGLSLESIIRGKKELLLSDTSHPKISGPRIEYDRGSVVEWYENKQQGLEQGFTIDEKLNGKGNLALTLNISGSLKPVIARDGKFIDFIAESNAKVLRYEGLHVFDAENRTIPSYLGLLDQRIKIFVNDQQAIYPITIDPILSSPSWTLEIPPESNGFGFSVGTAGDVNGDGYSDIIVGAYYCGEYVCNLLNKAFVYYGSTKGPSSTPDWSVQSNLRGQTFGTIVGSAGDVNGDGYSDIMVNGHVYHGSKTGLGKTHDWISNSGTVFQGGFAGDVNGDGYSDVILAENGVCVYYGSPEGLSDSPDWTADIDAAVQRGGKSVSGAGDVNGDGYSDIIIAESEGRVYAYYGNESGLGANGTRLNADWTSDLTTHDFLNRIDSTGDVNNDGYSDIIISNYSSAFIYMGSANGLHTTYDWQVSGNWARPAGDINGDRYSDVIVDGNVYYGSSAGLSLSPDITLTFSNRSEGNGINTAGDVNGDGFSDVVDGTIVYQGSPGDLKISSDWLHQDPQVGSKYGFSVSTANDVNGDGFDDVIIGAPRYDNGQVDEGKVFVYHGSGLGRNFRYSWTAEGNQAGARFGYSVRSAGNINGDQFSDIIIGAPYYDSDQVDVGKVFVYHGSYFGLTSQPAWSVVGGQSSCKFGYSVDTAGDVNGDGFSDVIIGAPLYSSEPEGTGKVFLYYGSADGLNFKDIWAFSGLQDFSIGYLEIKGGGFGYSVSTAGDVNGDSYSDVIIGAPSYRDSNNIKIGKAFVIYGSSSGLNNGIDWTIESSTEGRNFGINVSSAGDVNGDGFSDVLIGKRNHYSHPESFSGSSFLFLGSKSGLDLNTSDLDADWSKIGGYEVALAGDVNADGYSDVIVGTHLYNPVSGDYDENCSLFLGSGDGLNSVQAWSIDKGWSVGTAGDVNGDGYSDIIIGSTDIGEFIGTATIYYGSESYSSPVLLSQRRASGGYYIPRLGMSDSETSFRISAIGKTPTGRDLIQLEWEVKPAGVKFDAMGTSLSQWYDTGTTGHLFDELVDNLIGHTAYHWRARFKYAPTNPFGITGSHWYSPFPSNPDSVHFRTNNMPPTGGYIHEHVLPATLLTQSPDGSGNMTIGFKIKDAGQNMCTLKSFEYSTDGGVNWKGPVNGDSSDSLNGGWPDHSGATYSSAIDWSGKMYSFFFNTMHPDIAADFDELDQNSVKIRFFVNDGAADSLLPVVSESFRVDNLAPSAGTIIINNNNDYSNDATPELIISSNGADFMRFALAEGDLSTTEWISYNTTHSGVDISAEGNGQKVVWVEFKDEFGNIQSDHVSDTIIFETAPVVTSINPISNTPTPVWTWTTGGEGNSTYRFKLDDNPWSNGTSITSYMPSYELSQGEHTLYVEEQGIGHGWWSSSGSFTIVVDTGFPCSKVIAVPEMITPDNLQMTIDYTAYDIFKAETCGPVSSGTGLAKVELYVKAPGETGFTIVNTVENDAIDGSFVYSVNPKNQGIYRFYSIAQDNAGNVEVPPDGFDAETVFASQFAGYAIIAVGTVFGNEGIESHTLTANNIYRHLIARNFGLGREKDLDHIKYFNPFDTEQTGEDDYSEENTISYLEGLKNTITQWAPKRMQAQPGPLYLILLGHGTPDTFYLDDPDLFYAGELNGWLNSLETSEEPIVVILGTCYSGTFIDNIAKPGRIIISSTAADEPSWRGPSLGGTVRDGEFFVSSLFNELRQDHDLKTAFINATERTTIHTDSGYTILAPPYFDRAMQHPHLDDNGINDSTGVNEGSHSLFPGADGDLAATLKLGFQSDAPEPLVLTEIGIEPLKPLTVDNGYLWAKVSDPTRAAKVWVEISYPNRTLDLDPGELPQQIINMIRRPLSWNKVEKYYDYTHWGFTESGKYTVFFYGQDNNGIITSFKKLSVYRVLADNQLPDSFSTNEDLYEPVNNAMVNTPVLLEWPVITDPDNHNVTYTVLLSEDNDQFSNSIRLPDIKHSAVVVDQAIGLRDGHNYFWKVLAIDEYGAESGSAVRLFQINNQNAPPVPGILYGYVYDSDTNVFVDGATITVRGVLKLVSSLNGLYLGVVPAGSYPVVTVTAAGYADTQFQLGVGKNDYIRMNIGLKRGVGKGNINGDSAVDLLDCLIALQILKGLQPDDIIRLDADVNNDGQMGMSEVIYILQNIGEIRE